MNVFLIGTCRVHGIVTHIRGKAESAEITSHRMHSPHQVFRKIRFLSGEDTFKKDEIHTFSDLAIEQIASGSSPCQIFEKIKAYRNAWKLASHIVVEISTRRETLVLEDRRTLFDRLMLRDNTKETFVNYFFARDVKLYSNQLEQYYKSGDLRKISDQDIKIRNSSDIELEKAMKQIKTLAQGKKILWISHVRPASDLDQFANVKATRLNLASKLQSFALKQGDKFFDPSVLAQKIGDQIFFRDFAKNDIDHFSTIAFSELAEVYYQLLREA